MPQLWSALSIKQPWAALIVHGVKSIELRTWMTARRGLIAIHASKSPEADPLAWESVTSSAIMETAHLVGGIVGHATLVECITYTSRADFEADAEHHRAGPAHFRNRRMFGFRFVEPSLTDFVPCIGNTSFFPIQADLRIKSRQRRRPAGRLVVRLPEESP